MAEKEYIERDAAIESIRLTYCKECNSYNGVRCRACEFDDAMLMIEDVPAADVVEVVNASWVKATPYSQEYCTNCGLTPKTIFGILPNYCPHCGAKMDGGKTE